MLSITSLRDIRRAPTPVMRCLVAGGLILALVFSQGLRACVHLDAVSGTTFVHFESPNADDDGAHKSIPNGHAALLGLTKFIPLLAGAFGLLPLLLYRMTKKIWRWPDLLRFRRSFEHYSTPPLRGPPRGLFLPQ